MVEWGLKFAEQPLTAIQRAVTGDPGALRAAAGSHRYLAGTVACYGDDLARLADAGHDWRGAAADAFTKSIPPVRQRVGTVTQPALIETASTLDMAAEAP